MLLTLACLSYPSSVESFARFASQEEASPPSFVPFFSTEASVGIGKRAIRYVMFVLLKSAHRRITPTCLKPGMGCRFSFPFVCM